MKIVSRKSLTVIMGEEPWYPDIANYLAGDYLPNGLTHQHNKKLFLEIKYYFWDKPYLFRSCMDGIIRRCVFGKEIRDILGHLHNGPAGGHHWVQYHAKKVFDAGFYCPTIFKDVATHVRECDGCQSTDLECLRRSLAIKGTHFANDQLEKVLQKYGVRHRFSTPYHPQTNGQTEITNRALKRKLEKSVGNNRKFWADKLDDALWAFRTAFKTPTGTTPYKLVYSKNCHLPVELEHKAYWALQTCNFEPNELRANKLLQMNALEELRNESYTNSLIYKDKTKRWNDARLKENVQERPQFWKQP
ncbi:uncharacterized protein LOC111913733 [Lactuca sativa]|uniref:uncharacterized protein LOC111913733 n=1 Tax=Lactuca sativa TaxID=4236 RepID=UPI0022B074E2|nr:uncharacterized protein LOC111913733 [Lactuca sativa]